MDFTTHNSVNTNGQPLGTILAVYSLTTLGTTAGTLTNVALNYTNLSTSLIASNVNDLNTNSWPGQSRVTFQATLGSSYLIQVEGLIVAGVTNEGYITLNWSAPALFAGVLQFTTNVYVFGLLDQTIQYETDESIYPSLMNRYGSSTVITNPGIVTSNTGVIIVGETNTSTATTNSISTASTGEARTTITRTGGYRGRIQVDVTITNDWYTNVLETNIYVTNIVFETINTNDWPGTSNLLTLTNDVLANTAHTNIVVSNQNTSFLLQYDDLGTIATYEADTYFVTTTTTTFNNNGVAAKPQVNNTKTCGTNGPIFGTNFDAASVIGTNYASFTNITIGTNGSTNIVVTNIPASYALAVTNYSVTRLPLFTNVTPSALAGIDYDTNDYQTVTLDDFQTYKDVFFNILDYTARVPRDERRGRRGRPHL